jgi:cystathionine beta-lyase
MKHYSFDEATERRNSSSVKWDSQAIRGVCGNNEAEPFWVADMDFKAPQCVIDAATALAQHGIYGYSKIDGQEETFCTWAKSRHALDLNPSQVAISQGVLRSLATLVEQLSEEGDGIIIGLPAYQPFLRITNNLKRTVLEWPLLYDRQTHRFSLDWQLLEELLPKAKLMIFCSPHNPTGLVFNEEELITLCSLAAKHQVVILSDEIHADLSFEPHHSLLGPASETGCSVAVLMAPSKTFNIAGEHYSVTLFNDQGMKAAFLKRRDQLYASSNSVFSATLAVAAYRGGGEWLDQLLPYLKSNADFVSHYLHDRCPKLRFIAPMASFIGLIDCSRIIALVEQDAQLHPELYDDSQSPQGGLLSRFFGHRASVAMNDGSWFGGTTYKNFVRFNFAAPQHRILEALDRITEAVRQVTERYS